MFEAIEVVARETQGSGVAVLHYFRELNRPGFTGGWLI